MTTWTFPANLVDVHDGDTITVEADLGFSINLRVHVRLLDVYAPELKELPDAATGNPGGAATRQYVVDWMATRQQTATAPYPLAMTTTKLPETPDTFTRYVANIVDTAGQSLNDAVRTFLGGKQYGSGVH
jgi:endonuclease YncB( thermonuclease family)